jgi:predicted nuclease of restriction endonuclease-like (RecB) superfamily
MAPKRRTPPGLPDRPPSSAVPPGYAAFLRDLKERIRSAQVRAALSVNREVLTLYWHIGRSIVQRQQSEGWGTAVINRLGKDLQTAFPGISGFSRPNIYRMRAFYLAHAGAAADPIVSQVARQSDAGPPEPMASLPWFHNVLLVEKVKDQVERLWYARKAIEHGWSRPVLDHHIDGRLYRRQGKALTNFERTLPPP